MRLPKSWAEIRLKEYIKISELSLVDMDELDRYVKILAILSNSSEDNILSLEVKDLKEAIRSIQFIYSLPKANGIRSSIRIKGKRFAINNNIRKLTGGEYITFTTLTKDKSKITESLPDIIALFFHPINFLGLKRKKNYRKNINGEYYQTVESHEQTARLIRDNLTMDVVMEMSGFFLKSWHTLINATQDYLTKQTKKNKKMLEQMMADL